MYIKAQLMPLPLSVSCFSIIQIGFTFLVPAHSGSTGKKAVKRACVSTASVAARSTLRVLYGYAVLHANSTQYCARTLRKSQRRGLCVCTFVRNERRHCKTAEPIKTLSVDRHAWGQGTK